MSAREWVLQNWCRWEQVLGVEVQRVETQGAWQRSNFDLHMNWRPYELLLIGETQSAWYGLLPGEIAVVQEDEHWQYMAVQRCELTAHDLARIEAKR